MTDPSTTAASKVVLITGAGSGIGAATARTLAAVGHHVVLGARRTERLSALAEDIEARGGSALPIALDVTDPAGVRSFVHTAHDRYGRVDVLVNNAGVMPLSRLDALRVDEWNRMIDVNLRGVLYGIAAVLPLMRDQHGGHIVNISSVSGLKVDPTAAVYSATKHAVRALSEGLRQESRELRVTVVSPGLTRSELTASIGDSGIKDAVREQMGIAIPATAIAEAIRYAIDQPADVDVNEIVVRPTAQG
ncbi:SDR family oxidoreductase [Streptomyces clavuligerus]|uniref:Putative short-chain dehydrogenase/oxidoreductase n=1 Tax=Streptomyces clavuligerus TaxID=1901 RepID=B5GM61_STRCL|nr:SDR family oxidoreductase [Streptomyces clavuligerus]EDY47407.1 short-chain dehydrogenase/reductase SDR [Streptomyces clavuligerus]EFG05064.1 Putative short-chain dehydrogenase/oxidoreductase [Streptomyces clavuligerus]MBY6306531.1 SDR family oxidoreductase [Streptomyces clavuligerus]QCS10858.1 SDR family NAD(P)-dependent oxidoreductase [Streptomyces clavuligerus]QPJ97100.1 SDR family NAD(P)-dependent oxidoreductase [Streptomyces clavuligerus]